MKRLLLPLAAAVCLTAAPAWAGEDEPPAKGPEQPVEDPKPSEAQPDGKTAEPVPATPPAPGGMTRKDPGGMTRKDPGGMTRKDIEELVRRGGRLPEGFIPHGMRPGLRGDKPPGSTHREPPRRGPDVPSVAPDDGALQAALSRATGTLILKYLAEKDDPARAKVYEGLLKELGTTLSEGGDGTLAAQMPRILARLLGHVQEARRRGDMAAVRVYREILQVLGQAMTATTPAPPRFAFGKDGPPPTPPVPPRAVPAPAVPEPPAFEPRGWPRAFAGAALAYRVLPHVDPSPTTVLVRSVPADSVAQQIGLHPGDTILAIDGKAPTAASLGRAEEAITPGGKLRLKLRRKDGTIEVLDLEFEGDAEPAAAGSQPGSGR